MFLGLGPRSIVFVNEEVRHRQVGQLHMRAHSQAHTSARWLADRLFRNHRHTAKEMNHAQTVMQWNTASLVDALCFMKGKSYIVCKHKTYDTLCVCVTLEHGRVALRRVDTRPRRAPRRGQSCRGPW